MADSDPPASVLTPSQRDYHRSEMIDKTSATRAMEARIKGRVRAAVEIDFALLADRRDIVDPQQLLSDDVSGGLGMQQREGLAAMVSFVYRAAATYNLSPERLIERGIMRAERDWYNRQVNPDVNIEGWTTDISNITDAFDRGDPELLTESELELFAKTFTKLDGFDGEFFRELYSDTDPGQKLDRMKQAIELDINQTVLSLEQQLQDGSIAAAELVNLLDIGVIEDYETYRQLTRDERLLEPDAVTDERYQELLDETPPMLQNKTRREKAGAEED